VSGWAHTDNKVRPQSLQLMVTSQTWNAPDCGGPRASTVQGDWPQAIKLWPQVSLIKTPVVMTCCLYMSGSLHYRQRTDDGTKAGAISTRTDQVQDKGTFWSWNPSPQEPERHSHFGLTLSWNMVCPKQDYRLVILILKRYLQTINLPRYLFAIPSSFWVRFEPYL